MTMEPTWKPTKKPTKKIRLRKERKKRLRNLVKIKTNTMDEKKRKGRGEKRQKEITGHSKKSES